MPERPENQRPPYTGSGNRYNNGYPGQSGTQRKNQPAFQFPWWAILLAFVIQWPLGIAGLIINAALRKAAENQPAHPYAEPRAQAAPGPAERRAPAQPAAAPAKDADSKEEAAATILLIVGIVFAAIGCVAAISTVAEMIAAGSAAALLEDLVGGAVFSLGGLGMCLGSHRMKISLRMRRKLKNIVGKADHMYIRDIASSVPCSEEKCRAALEECIAKGLFGEGAYLDMRTRCLVVRGAAPQPEQPAPAKAEQAAPKGDTGQYEQILRELRELNDRIPGEEMSDKITRLEKVSAKIFRQAESSPQKLPQMRKFMDYYLPTALKLLKTYAELEAQGIEGDNIRDSKRRIEQAMDTLVVAFEKQLDQLFEGDALDVSTDIDVMENMLAADGLTRNNDPFNLYSVPKAPQPPKG